MPNKFNPGDKVVVLTKDGMGRPYSFAGIVDSALATQEGFYWVTHGGIRLLMEEGQINHEKSEQSDQTQQSEGEKSL